MTSAQQRLSRVLLAGITAVTLGVAMLASGPVSAGGYMKLGDIKGEVADKGHKGEIEILSWSWGETNSGTFSGGSGGGAGKVNKVEALTVKQRSSTAIEREMKESGEKGGTEDINIGVGELQSSGAQAREHDKRTTWIERSTSTPSDAEAKRKSIGQPKYGDITLKRGVMAAPPASGMVRVKTKMPWLACKVGDRYPMLHLAGEDGQAYRLSDVKVASCGGDADDRPTEEVAFYYNKIG